MAIGTVLMSPLASISDGSELDGLMRSVTQTVHNNIMEAKATIH